MFINNIYAESMLGMHICDGVSAFASQRCDPDSALKYVLNVILFAHGSQFDR